MTRLPGDPSEPISNAGPEEQRYGAWARVIPAGGRARFRLDDRFAVSLTGTDVTVRVVYLDDRDGGFRLDVAGKEETVTMKNSQRWQTAEFVVLGNSLRTPNREADVTVVSDHPLTLHMVEVVRGK